MKLLEKQIQVVFECVSLLWWFFLLVKSHTFFVLSTYAGQTSNLTEFYNPLVSNNRVSCCVVRLVYSQHPLLPEAKLVHHEMHCIGVLCCSAHLALSSSPAGFIHRASFQPLEVWADKWPAPVTVTVSLAFCRVHIEGFLYSPALQGGSQQGQEGLILLLWDLLDTLVNCKRVVYISMAGIGTHSSLGESLALCSFISSGKNATSVQKQSKTFYEWDPLNYNISEFPKAANRISCIVEEVLNTYVQTHRLFVSGSCSSEQAIRPGILLSLCCFLVLRKCCLAARSGRRGEKSATWHSWAVCRHTLYELVAGSRGRMQFACPDEWWGTAFSSKPRSTCRWSIFVKAVCWLIRDETSRCGKVSHSSSPLPPSSILSRKIASALL